jgi:hypothetical protein
LQQARPRRQLVELVEDDGAALLEEFDVLVLRLHHLLKVVNEHADAIHDATQTGRGREDERAAGRDEHGGRDHRRQHGDR